ncbi:MAG: hypothetical protein LQ339_005947 [Xanthoria mediterranea]|nr:MAG: hypothetical protein LQ339_005947 [Xanthoria mediterranea]
MSNKPIFVATHPRACSTAFERVFMTQRDTLKCVHEPFGDAFYYGSERLSSRYEDNLAGREDSGFTQSTYRTILDRFQREASEGKRLLIKDMAYYLFPPEAAPASIAPSVGRVKRGVGTTEAVVNGTTNGTPKAPYPYDTDAEPNNPTVIPRDTLGNFHFTFLIRHPRSSIPSYYRCCVPPLDEVTGFYDFMPSEAGYDELRRLFDYLRSIGQVGPEIAEENLNRRSASNEVDLSNGVHSSNVVTNGIHSSNGVLSNGDHSSNGVSSNGISANCISSNGISSNGISSNGISSLNGVHSSNGFTRGVEVCVIDADNLLDNPAGIVEAFCKSTGIDFTPDMLEWSTEADQQQAEEAFSKWPGFHDDAMNSCDLKPRQHADVNGHKKKKSKSTEDEDTEWIEKYGEKGAKIIRQTVDANIADYEYLKQFAINV